MIKGAETSFFFCGFSKKTIMTKESHRRQPGCDKDSENGVHFSSFETLANRCTYIHQPRSGRSSEKKIALKRSSFFCCDALLLVQRSAACPLLLELPLIPLLLANYLTGSLYNLLTLHVPASLLPGEDPGTSRTSSLQCDRDFGSRKRRLRPVDFCALVCARPRQTKHTRRKQSY